jgi:hypothetical protein
MCGIVGMVAKTGSGFWTAQADIFEELLYLDGVRGMDSTGAFQVSFNNSIRVAKQASNPGIFVNTDTFKGFKNDISKRAKIVIGHNRKATWGDISSKNAHPFMDKGSGIVLVHNGYISNHTDIDKTVDVDSQAIISSIVKEGDPVKGIGKLFGAWASVWYDHKRKKLYMARNSERPLHVIHTDQHMWIASEGEMLEWVLKRNKLNPTTDFELEPNKVYQVSTDTFSLDQFAVPPKVFTRAPANEQTHTEFAFPIHEDEDGETATCEFELDDKLDNLIRPMTEAARARARADAEAAFGERQGDPESVVKDIKRKYPFGSYVLFEVKTMVLGENKEWTTLNGMAWRPGDEPTKAIATIIRAHDNECYINPEGPLLAKVDSIYRRNNDVRLNLTDVRAPSAMLKDIAGFKVSHEEWAMMSQFLACRHCAQPFGKETIDFVKISILAGKQYEVTCQDCLFPNKAGSNGG